MAADEPRLRGLRRFRGDIVGCLSPPPGKTATALGEIGRHQRGPRSSCRSSECSCLPRRTRRISPARLSLSHADCPVERRQGLHSHLDPRVHGNRSCHTDWECGLMRFLVPCPRAAELLLHLCLHCPCAALFLDLHRNTSRPPLPLDKRDADRAAHSPLACALFSQKHLGPKRGHASDGRTSHTSSNLPEDLLSWDDAIRLGKRPVQSGCAFCAKTLSQAFGQVSV